MEIKIVGNTKLDLYLGIKAEVVTIHGIIAVADLIVEKISKIFNFFIEQNLYCKYISISYLI